MSSNQRDDEDDYVSEEDEDYVPSDVGEEDDTEEVVDEEDSNSATNQKDLAVNGESRNDGDKKKRVDDLWADFLTEAGELEPSTSATDAVSSPQNSRGPDPSSSTSSVSRPALIPAVPKKQTVTDVFDFAGEEVRVERVISHDEMLNSDKTKPKEAPKRKSAGGGLESAMNLLSKKPKLSTLAKSSIDWNTYKREHGIGEDLETHNRGKDGFLEKQDFLQRTDYRQFEAERAARNATRSKK